MAWNEQHLSFRAYWVVCWLFMYANCNVFEMCLCYCLGQVLFGLTNTQQKLRINVMFSCRRVGELLASTGQSNKDGDFTICVNSLMSRWLWGACWIFSYQLYLMKHIDFVVLIYVWDRWKKIKKNDFSDSAEVLDKAVELLCHFNITSPE